MAPDHSSHSDRPGRISEKYLVKELTKFRDSGIKPATRLFTQEIGRFMISFPRLDAP